MGQRDAIPKSGVTAGRWAAVALGLLTAAAAMILWRRWAGALRHPLAPGMLLGAGIAAAAVAAAVRVGWSPRAAGRWAVWPDWAASLLTSLAAAGLVVGLWLPGTRLLPIATIVSVLVVEEVGVGLWWSRRHATPGQDPSAGGTDVLRRPSAAAESWALTARQDAVATDDLLRRDKACLAHGSPPREIVQQLTRVRTPEDTEELRGWLRVPLASGQRTESVHLAFCPPLAATPELLVEQIDGPEARLKTGQLLPYGARIDLKLVSAADEPASVVLEFVARAPRNGA